MDIDDRMDQAAGCKEMLAIKAKRMNVEFVDLEQAVISKSALIALSSEAAFKYHVFPFDIRDNHLYLAMKDPGDIFLIDEIKVFTQMEIKPFLADGRQIDETLRTYYSGGGEEMKADASRQQDMLPFRKRTVGRIFAEGTSEKQDSQDKQGRQDSQEEQERHEMQEACKIGTVSLEDMDAGSMIRQIITASLKVENVTDIHIDTTGRNMIITLSVQY